MSATLTSPAEQTHPAKPADAWLGTLGINVQPMRDAAVASSTTVPSLQPTATARPAEPPPPVPAKASTTPVDPKEQKYQSALRMVAQGGAKLASPRPGSGIPKLKAAFDALPGPPTDRASITDIDASLDAAKPKLDMAELINAVDAAELAVLYAEGQKLHQGQRPEIAKYLENHEEKNQAAVEAARTALAEALDKGDLAAVRKAASQLDGAGKALTKPYSLVNDADRSRPLFDRAASLLAPDELPLELQKLKSGYAAAVKKHEDAVNEGKPARVWENDLKARIKKAQDVVTESRRAEATAWFDAAAPAAAPPGGDTAADPPAPPDAAAAKTAAMTARLLAENRQRMIAKYAAVLANGVKLDITPAQMCAIHQYSGGEYSNMNGLLRGSLDPSKENPEVIERARMLIELAAEGLDRMPKYDPGGFPVYRYENPYGDYLETRYKRESPVFEVKEFWSTGAGGGAPVDGATLEIAIWGKKDSRAKDIAMLSFKGASEGKRRDEAQLKGQGIGEVVFPPGTKFKTVGFHAFDPSGSDATRRTSKLGTLSSYDTKYRVDIMEV